MLKFIYVWTWKWWLFLDFSWCFILITFLLLKFIYFGFKNDDYSLILLLLKKKSLLEIHINQAWAYIVSFYKISKFFPIEIHYEVLYYLLRKFWLFTCSCFSKKFNFVNFCCLNSFMGESMLKRITTKISFCVVCVYIVG